MEDYFEFYFVYKELSIASWISTWMFYPSSRSFVSDLFSSNNIVLSDVSSCFLFVVCSTESSSEKSLSLSSAFLWYMVPYGIIFIYEVLRKISFRSYFMSVISPFRFFYFPKFEIIVSN